jgi:hypothetical protein
MVSFTTLRRELVNMSISTSSRATAAKPAGYTYVNIPAKKSPKRLK